MTSKLKKPQEKNKESSSDLINELIEIEKKLTKDLQVLEKWLPTQEETVQEEEAQSDTISVSDLTNRVMAKMKLYNSAGDALVKENEELKDQVKAHQFLLKEIEMERDVLLQYVHAYLETNSSLRMRLEEQRCQTGALQRQLNADLESRIRVLESDKEKLSELNTEKDRQIHKMKVMLEQVSKPIKTKEPEDKNLILALKTDLQNALEEKEKVEERYKNLKKRMDEHFVVKKFREPSAKKKNSSLKKSLSVGDVSWPSLSFTVKNIAEPSGDSLSNPSHIPQPLKASFCHESPGLKKIEEPETPIHNQLNSLKRGLYNVTRRLETLKSQLVDNGVIEVNPKLPENQRSLKRKASPIEGTDITEEPKSGLKNLKNILEDAKNLNAKLQNLSKEKLKNNDMIKKETGVQVVEKKNDKFSQTVTDEQQLPFRHFENEVMKLKKAVSDCEEKLDAGVLTKDEASACLVSVFSSSVLNNFRYFREWRRQTGFDPVEIDEGSSRSTAENGSGDNLLKNQISSLNCKELKTQISRLKHKIEHFQKG